MHSEIPISELDGLKLADKVFQRSENDNRLFDDADKMFDIIKAVMDQPAINVLRSSLQEPTVMGPAIAALIAAMADSGRDYETQQFAR